MRLEDTNGKESLLLRKEWGRAITSDSVDKLFDVFFLSTHAEEKVRCSPRIDFSFCCLLGLSLQQKQDVILVTEVMAIHAQLVRLRESIASDFLWSLYAGSVLLLRDAAATKCSAKVALVDFSYAFPEARPGHDNLLFGVTQLEERLRDWMERKIILKVDRWMLICFYLNEKTKRHKRRCCL
jgi:hypothetical protein